MNVVVKNHSDESRSRQRVIENVDTVFFNEDSMNFNLFRGAASWPFELVPASDLLYIC